MEPLKAFLHKILLPKRQVIFLCVPIATALLVYVLAHGGAAHWYAYPVFLFSAYALAILCVRIAVWIPRIKNYAEQTKERFAFTRRYFSDASYKTKVTLYLSLTTNVLYAIFKLLFGIIYQSIWFDALAGYYAMLALIRFALLRFQGTGQLAEWRSYRKCGILLFCVNMALTGVVVLVVYRNEGFHYPGYLIYPMAMYAFYKIIVAVQGMVQYRKYHRPVLSAAKVINLSAALVSMLALETAMLEQFDKSRNPEAFRRIMTGCTGGVVCVVIFGTAVYMIFHATNALRKVEQNT